MASFSKRKSALVCDNPTKFDCDEYEYYHINTYVVPNYRNIFTHDNVTTMRYTRILNSDEVIYYNNSTTNINTIDTNIFNYKQVGFSIRPEIDKDNDIDQKNIKYIFYDYKEDNDIFSYAKKNSSTVIITPLNIVMWRKHEMEPYLNHLKGHEKEVRSYLTNMKKPRLIKWLESELDSF